MTEQVEGKKDLRRSTSAVASEPGLVAGGALRRLSESEDRSTVMVSVRRFALLAENG